MSIKSIKHTKNKRALIPSTEEAGAEQARPAVRKGRDRTALPLNPILKRGRAPELFWMHKHRFGAIAWCPCNSLELP